MSTAVNSTMVQSIVVAIIVFLIQLLFLEFLVLANAQMQREIQAHCEIGTKTTITIRENQDLSAPGTFTKLKADGTTCVTVKAVTPTKASGVTAGAADSKASAIYYTEDGDEITVTAPADGVGKALAVGSVVTNGEWQKAPAIVDQFSGIILIIGEIIPLLLVVAIAAEAFALVYLRGSQGGITTVVGMRVALLVIAYVVILFSSTVFEFSEDALGVFLNGIITGTERFDEISKLLLSLIPLAYELLVLGILGWNTFSQGRAVRQRYNSRRTSGALAMSGGGIMR